MGGNKPIPTGLPNPSYFPFDTLEAQTAKPDRWQPRVDDASSDGTLASRLARTAISSFSSPHRNQQPAAASHIVVPHESAASDPGKRIDLTTALQYGQANGYPPLLSFIRQFTREFLHPNVPYAGGPEVIFTVGSTDGMSKVLELFINNWVPGKSDPRDRPGLLTEIFMYANVLGQVSAAFSFLFYFILFIFGCLGCWLGCFFEVSGI